MKMKLRKLIIATVAASSIGAVALPASADIWVTTAPPAPRHEVVPAPRAGYVWAPGYYDYRHGKYVWVSGHWERERHGMYWHPHRWVEKEGRWTMEKGRWDRERFVENERHGDRDGDGVPNRYDRAPDNPHRQ
jgi:hypothetical protein